MFVKYSPEHPHIKVVPVVNGDGLSVAAESVILNPGTNEVSDEKWERIKGSLAAEIADGSVTPFSVETKKSGQPAKAMTLKDVPASTATKIVMGCSNKATLRRWFSENLPDELALLVVKRMRQLSMDIDAIAGSGGELSDDDIIKESGTGAGKKSGGKAAESHASDGGGNAGSGAEDDESKPSKGGKGKSGGAKAGADDIPDFDNPDVKVG